jgi:hypothetical protein
MECVNCYQYLGLLLTEFLDYQLMAKAVAKSASRAFNSTIGLLIDHLNTLKIILSCSIIEHLAHCLIYAGFQPISPAIASFMVTQWSVLIATNT